MVQRSQNLGFTLKAGKAIRIVGECLGEDFQRHVPIQLGITSAIHLAHTALADLGGDGIRAEGGAGSEWHTAMWPVGSC